MLFSACDMKVPEALGLSKENQSAHERDFHLLLETVSLTPRTILLDLAEITTTIASFGASNTRAIHLGENNASVGKRGAGAERWKVQRRGAFRNRSMRRGDILVCR